MWKLFTSQCESFSDKPQKIWEKLGGREIDDSMWKTLFMNVNKISIAKEILETKLKSPTLRMKLIPAWLWDANTPKTNSLSAKFKRGMAGWKYSWRSSPPWGLAKTLITRFQTTIDTLGQTWHSWWTFSRSAFEHGNKVVDFGLKTVFLVNISGLGQKLSRRKTKMVARQNHNFNFCNIWRSLLRAMVDKIRIDLNLCEYATQGISRYMSIQLILTSLLCLSCGNVFKNMVENMAGQCFCEGLICWLLFSTGWNEMF